MIVAVPPLLLALLLTAPPAAQLPPHIPAQPPAPQTDTGTSDTGVDWNWTIPPTASPAALAEWHAAYSRQIRPVMSAWARMLRRLRGDLPALFEPQCNGLVASLQRLDESVILPVPDRLIDFYLRRLLLHLHAAATACSREELWNVVYRLEEARSNLGEMRWLLEVKGLG